MEETARKIRRHEVGEEKRLTMFPRRSCESALVGNVRGLGRKESRKEGRKESRKEGKKVGRKERK